MAVQEVKIHIQSAFDASGVGKAIKALSDFNKKNEEFNKVIKNQVTALGKVSVEWLKGTKAMKTFGEATKGVGSAMFSLKNLSFNLSSGFQKLTANLLKMKPGLVGVAIAIGVLVKGFANLYKQTAEYAQSLYEFSIRSGNTVENMRKLEYVARRNNMSFEDMTKSIEVFDLKMANTQGTFNKTVRALDRIGVQVEDNNGVYRESAKIYEEVLTKMSKMDDVSKSEFATDIFGRQGAAKAIKASQDFVQLLEEANEKVREIPIERILQMNDMQRDIAYMWSEIKMQISLAFMPFIEKVLPAVNFFLDQLHQGVGVSTTLSWVFEALGNILLFVIEVLAGIGMMFDSAGQSGVNATNQMGEGLNDVGQEGAKTGSWIQMIFGRLAEFLAKIAFDIAIAFNGLWLVLLLGWGKVQEGWYDMWGKLVRGFIDKVIRPLMEGWANVVGMFGKEIDVDARINDKLLKSFNKNEMKKQEALKKTRNAIDKTMDRIEHLQDYKADIDGLWTPDYGSSFNFRDFTGTGAGGTLDYQRSGYGPAPPISSSRNPVKKNTGALEDLTEAVEEQTAIYKLVFGDMFKQRGFFEAYYNSSVSGRRDTLNYGGRDIGARGLGTSINIQSLSVRNDRDIKTIAEELNRLSKRENRKGGYAYGY